MCPLQYGYDQTRGCEEEVLFEYQGQILVQSDEIDSWVWGLPEPHVPIQPGRVFQENANQKHGLLVLIPRNNIKSTKSIQEEKVKRRNRKISEQLRCL